VRRKIACGHERAIGERDTEQRRLRADDERPIANVELLLQYRSAWC
jgi:hypothetical protein